GVADRAVPEGRLLRGAALVQLDVDVVHVGLRRIEALLPLAVLAVAVRVVAHLAVRAAPPGLAVVDQALDAHAARERDAVAVLVGRGPPPDQRQRVGLAGRG